MKEPKVIIVEQQGEISRAVAMRLSDIIRKRFEDPEYRAGFERWKAERDRKSKEAAS